MRKSYVAITLVILLLSGCFWSGDEDGNYYVQVNNNTDDVIFVYYDTSITSIAKGNYEVIAVSEVLFDADIRVEYKGIIRTYDIDPDFFGWDEINVNIENFTTASNNRPKIKAILSNFPSVWSLA